MKKNAIAGSDMTITFMSGLVDDCMNGSIIPFIME